MDSKHHADRNPQRPYRRIDALGHSRLSEKPSHRPGIRATTIRSYVNTHAGGPSVPSAGDPDVYIYENMLCLPRRIPVKEVVWLPDNVSVIDELRYHATSTN